MQNLIKFEIYHDLIGYGEQRDEICTQSNLMMYVMDPLGEEACASSGTYGGLDYLHSRVMQIVVNRKERIHSRVLYASNE